MAPQLVKLHNKGKRKITGHIMRGPEGNQRKIDWEFNPDETIAFDPATAARLKELYPNEITSLDDVKKQFEDEPVKEEVQEESPKVAARKGKRSKAEIAAAEAAKAAEDPEEEKTSEEETTEE